MGLSDLFANERDPQSVVARRWDSDAGGERSFVWQDFRSDVARLRAKLEVEQDGAWLLVTEDAYAFAVGLFALWHSQRFAVCPPNHQPGSLLQLQTSTSGVVTDRPDWFSSGSILDALSPASAGDGSPGTDWPALSLAAPAVQLFTSGTTGEGKPVSKSVGHLHAELEQLEALWGERLGGAEVFGTASHQHLYGLIFRVLWPLCARRPFRSDIFLHTRELVPRMLASGDCALASVPTHLKRMVRQPGVTDLLGCCRSTFSSGGMLPRETALDWAEAFGEAPIEVLGSTETGGVAWRIERQTDALAGAAWTPLPGVSVSREEHGGQLRVQSPFVSTGDAQGSYTMGDRVSMLPDGTFQLEGRSDRVVKVAEKRLDLEKMESALRANSLVEDVVLLLLEQDSDARVAAVLVPTEEGRTILEEAGRTVLGRILTESLATDWDRVLLPRLWRTVQHLPENEQGKTTTRALEALFNVAPNQTAAPDRPTVVEEHVDEDSLEQLCAVPDDLQCLPNHFPDFPVVPGVMQLDWALELASTLFGRTLDVREIGALKFHAPLGPGVRFRMRVERTSRDSLSFRIWNDEHEFTSGRARIAAAAGGE